MPAYTFCSVDDVKEAKYSDRNSHSWSIYKSNQRLWEVDVSFHILPVISNTTNVHITLLTAELKYIERSQNVSTFT